MDNIFRSANKRVYIGISAVLVWLCTGECYRCIDNMIDSEDAIITLFGMMGSVFAIGMVIASVVQLVILVGVIFAKKQWLKIIFLVLEIIFFALMQFFVIVFMDISASIGVMIVVMAVAFEVFNVLGIISMIRDVKGVAYGE